MIRPPRPCSRRIGAGRAVEEEAGLQVDVVLEVPVLLGHLVDVVAADQHGGDVREHVEAAECRPGRAGAAARAPRDRGRRAPPPGAGRPRASATSSRDGIAVHVDRADAAPAAANADATARPIPPPAPVTTTLFPSSPAPMLQLTPPTPSMRSLRFSPTPRSVAAATAAPANVCGPVRNAVGCTGRIGTGIVSRP